ncbi:MAG TPA: pirin-like C-terminal cupin domain-containing protein, partial [Vicinamibacterales bacterium]|nr:pirin-like C-terminal cupin domain-containing protein [Vicinamibacterales bacterium]
PDPHRQMPASFAHVAEVPVVETSHSRISVFAGSLLDAGAAAPYFSELVGADLQVQAKGTVEIPLARSFEHGVLVLEGDGAIDGESLEPRMLYYLGTKRSQATFTSRAGARVLLIGGPPFPEPILMWWNFVARTPEEIAQARDDWEQHRRFGDVPAYAGPRLTAPSLLRFARANPAS